ncbi:DUF3021 domain-containing protein [Streptococcus macacae]|uniref:PF11457 family protein n=1 Tax=Streptococcus macacae NCTC 11558 TaxID=764298 RepID=G5JWT7_9STRE|nr:DUF3021 domain-containing protein [Streptococcus macacae]EHJ51940.1 hypothetical protein STRMA_1234 [Streptococcus macacae NCTC 11558]SUN79046.1 membrane protein [Streptococcus macacae NCTC 11558]
MKKIMNAILSGVRTGGLVYLLVLLFDVQKSSVSKSNIISVLIMSACIGVVNLIFESDRFSFLQLLIIHFLIILGLVSAMMIYNGWGYLLTLFRFWFDFILIYFIIWCFVRLDIYLKTQKINRALSHRQNNQE